jgi:hypothetical protein
MQITITQALSANGFLASELEYMDSIRRFCALSYIYHRILTMVEEGKQVVPQDIVKYSLLKSLD